MMPRHFRAPLLLVAALVLAASCAGDPVYAAPLCWGIAPVCPLTTHAICLCPSVSRFSCHWECVTQP